jgi:L-2-hydroxyglutarate oxidase LhgO
VAEESIGIIGGGIVGLAIARELGRRRPDATVTVFEKEDRLAAHQTGHNSGVVHAGIYYKPGSLKAVLCRRGRKLLRDYCAERSLPYVECGKLVVAVESSELGRFDALEQTARQNDVPGLRRVDHREIVDIEPHAAGLAALHSPATAITDYVAVAQAMAEEITTSGGRILLSTPITGIRRNGAAVDVRSASAGHDDVHQVDRLVVCAGLQSDRVGKWADGHDEPRIVPFRGEYMAVSDAKRDFVRGMVYPVPDPRYPFLGVHFTRRVSGELEVGPNAVLALGREGYRRSAVNRADVASLASWPGFWHLARQHWRTGALEMRGSLSVKAYMRVAQRYVPDIGAADVRRAGAGIRAQAVDRNGSLVDDFRITQSDGVASIRNAPSPAATSSLAIAEYVVDQLDWRS